MDKVLLFLNTAIQFAEMVVNLPFVPQNVRDAAAKLLELRNEVQTELKRPDLLARFMEYIKHHGNLPGTPETRGEKS